MKNEQANDWDPLDAAVLNDQRAAYDDMRERCPVAHSESFGWSLFRHKDIAKVVADPQTFSNSTRFLAIPNGLNPPVHGPCNSALAAFFNPEQMKKLEPCIHQLARDQLQSLLSDREAEFVKDFITPFALKSLCAFLGWPETQWQCLAGWIHGNQQVAFKRDHATGKALAEMFAVHVRRNLNLHRDAAQANGDATDRLLSVKVEGNPFTDAEIVSILRNWAAGHGTTEDALGIVILHLAQDSRLQERLRQDFTLIPAAIEEILRVDGPLVANRRTTTREVEIGGKTIPKDEALTLMWIAANRDPDAFEDADTVQLERNTRDGMVWGQGIHLCIGAPLARLEIRVVLEELLAATTRFTLAAASPARKVYPGNGFATLPLRFE
jgi:cytochrome P450